MYAATAQSNQDSVLPTNPSPPSAAPPRRQKPRPVIYKSSALVRTDPILVAKASPAALSASCGIRRAEADAERVRDEFKLAKCGPEINVGDAHDEASNALRYRRRLLMNRHSAAASRVRREAYTKALEAQVVEQEASLAAVSRALEEERATIQCLLADRGNLPEEDLVEEHLPPEESLHPEFDLRSFPPHLLREGLPPLDVMESQTEEAGPPVSNAQHLPIRKAEDELLFEQPLPMEGLILSGTNDQLLHAFLYEPVNFKPEQSIDQLDLL